MPGTSVSPDLGALQQLYTYGDQTLDQVYGPVSQMLKQRATQSKQRASEQYSRMGLGRSDVQGRELSDIDIAADNEMGNILSSAAASRAERQYMEKMQNDERARQEEAYKQQQDKAGTLGGLGLLGQIAGAGLGLMIPGAGLIGAGFGSQIGGELARGIGGLEYGETPQLSGLQSLAGYMGQQQQVQQQQENWDNMFNAYSNRGGAMGQNPSATGYGNQYGMGDYRMGVGGINKNYYNQLSLPLGMGQPVTF